MGFFLFLFFFTFILIIKPICDSVLLATACNASYDVPPLSPTAVVVALSGPLGLLGVFSRWHRFAELVCCPW